MQEACPAFEAQIVVAQFINRQTLQGLVEFRFVYQGRRASRLPLAFIFRALALHYLYLGL